MNTSRRTTHLTGRVTALALAGALVGLALAPTSALADHPTSGGDAATTTSGDPWGYLYDETHRADRHRLPPAKLRHDYLVQRKAHPALARIMVAVSPSAPATCYLPGTLDPETRRLIAVQLCSDARIVPAVFLARGVYFQPGYALGHV